MTSLYSFTMGVSSLSVSAICTVLSFICLQWWTHLSIEKLKSDGSIGANIINSGNAGRVLELLLGSYVIVSLLASFVLNVFILLILCLKVMCYFQEIFEY